MATLFERIGGKATVNEAVDIFYYKVLSDIDLSRFFYRTDMAAQHVRQKAFLTFLFGGADHYTGKSMRAAHAHLREEGLNEEHFHAVVSHLQSTLEDMGVTTALIEEVLLTANSYKDDILNL